MKNIFEKTQEQKYNLTIIGTISEQEQQLSFRKEGGVWGYQENDLERFIKELTAEGLWPCILVY